MVQLSNTIVPLENRGYTLKTDEIVAMAVAAIAEERRTDVKSVKIISFKEMGNLEENGNEPLQN